MSKFSCSIPSPSWEVLAVCTNIPFCAYLRRFLNKTVRGKHSLCLWGPGDGLGACKQPAETVSSYGRKLQLTLAHKSRQPSPVDSDIQVIERLLKLVTSGCDGCLQRRPQAYRASSGTGH